MTISFNSPTLQLRDYLHFSSPKPYILKIIFTPMYKNKENEIIQQFHKTDLTDTQAGHRAVVAQSV
jgi:hypothetical protein